MLPSSSWGKEEGGGVIYHHCSANIMELNTNLKQLGRHQKVTVYCPEKMSVQVSLIYLLNMEFNITSHAVTGK